MKNTKLLITAVMIFIITLSVFFLAGCSKQEKNVTSDNTENEPVAVKQHTMDGQMNDSSMQMNQDDINMDMEKDISKENMQHKMIKIPTAQCDVCKDNITKALNKVKGIQSFKVDIDGKVVHINFDKTITNINIIENAITMAGYAANNKKADPEAYSKLDDCCKLPEDRKNKK